MKISDDTIREGMRLLAKAGRRIDAAFCGKIVKRNFVIRDEILKGPQPDDAMINKIREDFCRLMLQ